ncbi:MAG: hypothetical protein ACFB15_10850 [Cyclobacteriaceae bacterium]
MKTLTIELPGETNEQEAKRIVVTAFFAVGILSLGQAALFLSISK